jgi:hypothetical protein
MELSTTWLFKKLREIGCSLETYQYDKNSIELFGNYPKEKYTTIKRFFYDNYPCVHRVEIRKMGIKIYFLCNVSLMYGSSN